MGGLADPLATIATCHRSRLVRSSHRRISGLRFAATSWRVRHATRGLRGPTGLIGPAAIQHRAKRILIPAQPDGSGRAASKLRQVSRRLAARIAGSTVRPGGHRALIAPQSSHAARTRRFAAYSCMRIPVSATNSRCSAARTYAIRSRVAGHEAALRSAYRDARDPPRTPGLGKANGTAMMRPL